MKTLTYVSFPLHNTTSYLQNIYIFTQTKNNNYTWVYTRVKSIVISPFPIDNNTCVVCAHIQPLSIADSFIATAPSHCGFLVGVCAVTWPGSKNKLLPSINLQRAHLSPFIPRCLHAAPPLASVQKQEVSPLLAWPFALRSNLTTHMIVGCTFFPPVIHLFRSPQLGWSHTYYYSTPLVLRQGSAVSHLHLFFTKKNNNCDYTVSNGSSTVRPLNFSIYDTSTYLTITPHNCLSHTVIRYVPYQQRPNNYFQNFTTTVVNVVKQT